MYCDVVPLSRGAELSEMARNTVILSSINPILCHNGSCCCCCVTLNSFSQSSVATREASFGERRMAGHTTKYVPSPLLPIWSPINGYHYLTPNGGRPSSKQSPSDSKVCDAEQTDSCPCVHSIHSICWLVTLLFWCWCWCCETDKSSVVTSRTRSTCCWRTH
jgi:hypothetical protein